MLKDGSTRTVTLDDMLFVAPYNAQAARLSEALEQALGVGARVGSVDRFQGQEAPIVFLSLCSSDATGSPRGIGFLFDQRRLNVAVSRAESLCVIVGHPRLAVTPVATLADLKRVNFVAALMAAGEPCGALWRKGESSGHVQVVRDMRLDCDGDVILMKVEQQGGIACHTGRRHCFWRQLAGDVWQTVEPVLKSPSVIYGDKKTS